MDENRFDGAVTRKSGEFKTGVGEAVGDNKLQAEGRADQARGGVQNAVGSAADSARDAYNSAPPGVRNGLEQAAGFFKRNPVLAVLGTAAVATFLGRAMGGGRKRYRS